MPIFTLAFCCNSARAQSKKVIEKLDPLEEELERQIRKDIEEKKEKKRKEKEERERPVTMGSVLSKTRKNLSQDIANISDSLDEFFSGEKSEEEASGSRLRLGYEAFLVEGEDPLYNFEFNTKLNLPYTKKRLKFLLQSLDDETSSEIGADSPTEQAVQNTEAQKKQSLFAGLRFRNFQSKEASFNTDAGLKLVWPPDPFARVRMRKSFFMKEWELRFTENIYWFESSGWRQEAAVEWVRPLNSKHSFHQGNTGLLKRDPGYWQFNHYVGWYHKSSQKDAVGYFAGIHSNEEPAYALIDYYLSISYRRQLFEDWIYLDIAPTGTWPREKNFTFVPSIRLKLEAAIGDF